MVRFVVLLMTILSGCAYGSYISDSSNDYNVTVEDATVNDLVANILRARDGAPLYFSDLSQIRGSLTISAAAQATFPFGPIKSPVRDSFQAGAVSLQNAPTFDIAPLNTKQFSQGMLEPISINILSYYVNRLDPEIVLNLFIGKIESFEEIRPKSGPITYHTVGKAIVGLADLQRQISQWINSDFPPKVNIYSKSSTVGPAISTTLLQNPQMLNTLVQASSSGLKPQQAAIGKGKGAALQLVKSSTQSVLCVLAPSDMNSPPHYMALGIAAASVVNGPSIQIPDSDRDCEIKESSIPDKDVDTITTARTYKVVHLRSTQAIFYYLGALLNPAVNTSGVRPFDFYINLEQEFARRRDTCTTLTSRWKIGYRGLTYFIGNYDENCDLTVVVLQVLNDLLNLHRDANEIPTTKAVQTVPVP